MHSYTQIIINSIVCDTVDVVQKKKMWLQAYLYSAMKQNTKKDSALQKHCKGGRSKRLPSSCPIHGNIFVLSCFKKLT